MFPAAKIYKIEAKIYKNLKKINEVNLFCGDGFIKGNYLYFLGKLKETNNEHDKK